MRRSKRNPFIVCFSIFFTLLLSPGLDASASSLSFNPSTNFAVGAGPLAVAVGDFNRDGKPDVAVSHQYGSGIAVLLGDGSGTLGTPAFFAVQAVPKYLAVGDFNQDGALDLAVPNYGSDSVSILLGNGMGGFEAATNFPAGVGPNGLAAGDFNRDGNLDVVVTNTAAAVPSISILLGDGAGGLGAPATFSVGFAGPIGIAVADLNDDGKLDVAVAGQGGGVSVLLGNGLGGFGGPMNVPTDGDAVWVAVGDVNLDGVPDLVVVNEHETAERPAISILLGNGLGGFSAPRHFAVGGGPENLYVTVGDFDRDGKPDLAVAKFNAGSVGILRGDGTGNFQALVDFAVGSGPNAVTTGDLNGDGKPDLITANFFAGSVSVRVNTTTIEPAATFSFSSSSFAPPTNVAVGSGPLAVAVGDFNRDGKADVAVSHQYGSGIAVLLGNGTGGLSAPTFFAVQAVPKYLAVGDFNQDGALDLAVPNYGSDSVSILLGNGMGGFEAATNFPAGVGPNGLAAGDFNRDGNLDVVVTNTAAAVPSISILLGDGAGGLGAPATFSVGFAGPIGVAVADLNNDGKLDVAVAGQGGGMSVLLGNGLGGFGGPMNFPTDGDAVWVAVGDVNLDGALDLVAVNEHETGYPAISILLGNGLGGFSAPTHFPTGGGPENLYVTIGDFDRDGKPDLAVAKFNASSIGILRGDGTGAFQAPVDFTVGSGPNAVAAGDLNGDGKLDLITANFWAGSVSVRVKVGNLTPSGTDVAVSLGTGTVVTFGSVSSSGETGLTTSTSGPPAPAGFTFGNLATYFGITSTATFTGPVAVCITYDPAQFTDLNSISLLHFENDAWVDVTTSNDTINSVICGEVNSLSPFVIAQRSPPEVGTLSSNPAAVGGSVLIATETSVAFSAPWTDPNMSDTHTAVCNIVDVFGTSPPITVAGAAPGSGSGTATCNVTFTNTGIFSVTMTVTDEDGASGTSTAIQVVVYDPSAGFVTGGGWFTPDPQTCVCTPGSKATFGFVSQYKKGTSIPTGNQEFQYKVDNVNLHSTSFDWLVVSGPQAQFQGTGTINGLGAFKFRVTVRDGDLIGQPDRFEIRILPAGSTDFSGSHLWKGGNDLTDSNGAGSIVIHH